MPDSRSALRRLLIIAVLCLVAGLTSPYPPAWASTPLSNQSEVAASAYSHWSLVSLTAVPTPGTYVLNLEAANPPTANGENIFDPLVPGAPVTVGAGSQTEFVVPTAISHDGNHYTITVTLTDAHPGRFYVSSGTGGLAEAIQAVANSGGGTVVLDPRWNSPVPLPSIPGRANVQILDPRGGQTTWYTWDGSRYQPNLSIPAGAATNTPVQIRDLAVKGPWYDPRSWGAKCDGATDDTTAFEALIAYATAHPGTILLPPSTCDVRQLNLSGASGLEIRGQTRTRPDGTPLSSTIRITGDARGSCGLTALVSTSGTQVTWLSGDDFSALEPGDSVDVGSSVYTVASVTDAHDLVLTASAGTQPEADLAYNLGALTGGISIVSTPSQGPTNIVLNNFALTTNAAPDCLLKIAADGIDDPGIPAEITVTHVSFQNDDLSSTPVRSAIYIEGTTEDSIDHNDTEGCANENQCAFSHAVVVGQQDVGSGGFFSSTLDGNVFGSLAPNHYQIVMREGENIAIRDNVFEMSGDGILLQSGVASADFLGLDISNNWFGDEYWGGTAGTAWISAPSPILTSRISGNSIFGNTPDSATPLTVSVAGSIVTASTGTFQPGWVGGAITIDGNCLPITGYLSPIQVTVSEAWGALTDVAAYVGQSGILIGPGAGNTIASNQVRQINGCAVTDFSNDSQDVDNYLEGTSAQSSVLLSLDGSQKIVASNSFAGAYAADVSSRGSGSGLYLGSITSKSTIAGPLWFRVDTEPSATGLNSPVLTGTPTLPSSYSTGSSTISQPAASGTLALSGANGLSSGTIALSDGAGSHTFTTPYAIAPVCTAADTTAPNPVKVSATASAVAVSGTADDTIAWQCSPPAN